MENRKSQQKARKTARKSYEELRRARKAQTRAKA
jgi:hypothetical protein